jgi:hypothetical protein
MGFPIPEALFDGHTFRVEGDDGFRRQRGVGRDQEIPGLFVSFPMKDDEIQRFLFFRVLAD